MECLQCQTINPDGAKFCMGCGESLANRCPSCATALPENARFCFNCGHKIAASQPPPAAAPVVAKAPAAGGLHRFIPLELLQKIEKARDQGVMLGERRIVTMLFCDIKGSTAAAEQLDPEEWSEIVNGAFQHMIAPIYTYEGTVARLMGDALLAFFGAPIAHEDDPRRAVMAGLDILDGIGAYRVQVQQEWGLEIDVRIGINTGLVVVGAVGSDLRMEYTAMGDAINLAARMEQTALPGTVQISADTYRLVSSLFEFESLGPISVKGKAEQVEAYRVLRPKRVRTQQRGIDGLVSPLIGRDAEMHTLRGAIIALRQGRGAIVSVIGEAGLGKSRLIADLRRSPTPVEGVGADLTWLAGASLSFETNVPYAPFIDLFRSHFETHDDEADASHYRHVRQGVARVMGERVDEIAPYFGSLLDLTLHGDAKQRLMYQEPPELRGNLFNAVRAYLERLCERQPVVLLLDDLHWIDPTSLALLASLLPLTDRLPLLLLTLFRPRRHEPSWQFHEQAGRDYPHRYMSIFLRPLDEMESKRLVSSLLEVDDLPAKVRQMILEKADGNPFYVEEVIRSLLDAGLVVRRDGQWHATREIEGIKVPNTLAAVINTRLDRLDEAAKQALQAGAVIGREFGVKSLGVLYSGSQPLDQALAALQQRELIRDYGGASGRRYLFKHALTREAAYQSLLLKQRREMHLQLAVHFENNEPDRAAEIARHFVAARNRARALPYLVAAGDRAAAAYASTEAIDYYEQALAILETVDDRALLRRTYEGLGGALTFAGDGQRAIEVYREMLQKAEAFGDAGMRVSALNKLSYVAAIFMGQFDEATNYLTEADITARAEQDKHGLSEMSLIRCMMCTAQADFDGVIRYMDETVELGRELGAPEQMSLGYEHIANTQIFMLELDKAWVTFQDGLALTQKIGDKQHEAGLLAGSGAPYHMFRGEIDKALQKAQRGLAIAKEIGSIAGQLPGHAILGHLTYLMGAYGQAIAHYKKLAELSNALGRLWYSSEALCRLGTVYLDISPELRPTALQYHLEAMEMLATPIAALSAARVWVDVGECKRQLGDLNGAAELFELSHTQQTVYVHMERPRALLGLAEVAIEQGRVDDARHPLRTAAAMIAERGLRVYEPQLACVKGRLYVAEGNLEAALQATERAAELATQMDMQPQLFDALLERLRLMHRLGRDAEAGAVEQQAQQTIELIADRIDVDDLRGHFERHAHERLASITSR